MNGKALDRAVIGACIALAVAGAVLGVYCFNRGNNGGHNGNEMDTFGMYAGFCLDAAVVGVLGAIRFAVRRWSASEDWLFFGGGMLLLAMLGPVPGFVLGMTLENDAESFLAMATCGCILLAALGAAMVLYSAARPFRNGGSPYTDFHVCRNCGCKVPDVYRTCRECGAKQE